MGKTREWADRWEGFLSAPNRRALVLTAVVSLLIGLLTLFAQQFMVEWLWNPLYWGWRTLADTRLGAAGVVFAYAILASVVLAFVDTSPNAKVFSEWLDRRASVKRLGELEREAERLRGKYRSYNWHWTYGRQRPDVAAVSKADFDFVAIEIARLDSDHKALRDALGRIVEELLKYYEAQGKDAAAYYVGQHFVDKVWNPARYSLSLVRFPNGAKADEPDEDKDDPRAALKGFLDNYDELRLWLARLARLQGRGLASFEHFAEWQRVDAAYYDTLTKLPNVPAMQEMRFAVSSHREHRKSPDDLRTLAPDSPTDTEIQTLRQALSSPSGRSSAKPLSP